MYPTCSPQYSSLLTSLTTLSELSDPESIAMMRGTISNLFARKIITLPRLSPTHTKAQILERLIPTGNNAMEYQPIITVKCSSDLIADPADRITPNHQHIMLLECMEEGTVRWNNNAENLDWIDVGTILGEVTTEDDCDGGGVEEDEEWTWQAYLHDDVDEST